MKYTYTSIITFSAGLAISLFLPLYFLLSPLDAMLSVDEEVAASSSSMSSEGPYCGNGVVEDREQCDDANLVIQDGCSGCWIEEGYVCTGTPSVCAQDLPAACGDGIIGDLEMCDDANMEDGDGCSSMCEIEDGAECRGMPSVCIAGSSSSSSESSVSSAESSSISSDMSSSISTSSDSSASSESSESSVPAKTTVDESASSKATSASSASSTSSKRIQKIFQHRREEDPRNVTEQAQSAPAPAPSPTTAAKPGCGDGVVMNDEQCDDGDLEDGDGCTSACQTQKGYMCHGMPSKCVIACGDGIIMGTETCDDGSNADGDGCSAVCKLEAGYACSGEPSVCKKLTPEG